MARCIERADVVVLTSRSEGIPLVLMEAMARGKIVLAPAITGIPELVIAERLDFFTSRDRWRILWRGFSGSFAGLDRAGRIRRFMRRTNWTG